MNFPQAFGKWDAHRQAAKAVSVQICLTANSCIHVGNATTAHFARLGNVQLEACSDHQNLQQIMKQMWTAKTKAQLGVKYLIRTLHGQALASELQPDELASSQPYKRQALLLP